MGILLNHVNIDVQRKLADENEQTTIMKNILLRVTGTITESVAIDKMEERSIVIFLRLKNNIFSF